MLGYTFDRQDLADALVNCRRAGREVLVVLDSEMSLNGRTQEAFAVIAGMHASGVKVILASGGSPKDHYAAVGRNVGGFQGSVHAKALLVGRQAIVGSTNWTTASRANHEVSVHMVLESEGAEFLASHISAVAEAGAPWVEAQRKREQRAASPVARRTVKAPPPPLPKSFPKPDLAQRPVHWGKAPSPKARGAAAVAAAGGVTPSTSSVGVSAGNAAPSLAYFAEMELPPDPSFYMYNH